jgi:hypothetical protein
MQMINYGLLLGTVTWVLLIVKGAQTLKADGSQDLYQVMFGPLTLTRLSRQQIENGSTVRFSLEQDFLWYVLIWLVVGGTLGLLLVYYTRKALQK